MSMTQKGLSASGTIIYNDSATSLGERCGAGVLAAAHPCKEFLVKYFNERKSIAVEMKIQGDLELCNTLLAA